MTEVTEAMIEAGLAVFKIGPTGWSATDAATVADIYETMEAARIPAAPEGMIERAARALRKVHNHMTVEQLQGGMDMDLIRAQAAIAALSAIPIPAPTGECCPRDSCHKRTWCEPRFMCDHPDA